MLGLAKALLFNHVFITPLFYFNCQPHQRFVMNVSMSELFKWSNVLSIYITAGLRIFKFFSQAKTYVNAFWFNCTDRGTISQELTISKSVFIDQAQLFYFAELSQYLSIEQRVVYTADEQRIYFNRQPEVTCTSKRKIIIKGLPFQVSLKSLCFILSHWELNALAAKIKDSFFLNFNNKLTHKVKEAYLASLLQAGFFHYFNPSYQKPVPVLILRDLTDALNTIKLKKHHLRDMFQKEYVKTVFADSVLSLFFYQNIIHYFTLPITLRAALKATSTHTQTLNNWNNKRFKYLKVRKLKLKKRTLMTRFIKTSWSLACFF